MAEAPIDVRDSDRQIWEQELDDFVPMRVLDAHCHFFTRAHFRPNSPYIGKDKGRGMRTDVDLNKLDEWAAAVYPGRQMFYLILGTPLPGIIVDQHVSYVVEQIKDKPHIRHNRVVTPACKIEDIERDVKAHGFVGLKPYRLFVEDDIHQCRIERFLSHEQMELANDMGLWVTMHLSRYDGCADEQNLADLEDYTTKRYPNIKWILAHCARSFTYWPIRQAVDRLRAMPNIWYDLAAVTDPRPFVTLFTKEDHRRLFFGADAVFAAYFHGCYQALGRSWQHFDADQSDLNWPHCDGRPILAVYEQLMSMKFAAEVAGFSRDQIEDIFWRNATTALGIEVEATAGATS